MFYIQCFRTPEGPNAPLLRAPHFLGGVKVSQGARPRQRRRPCLPAPGHNKPPHRYWPWLQWGARKRSKEKTQALLPNLPSVTSDKPDSLSGPQFLHLHNVDNITPCLGKPRVDVRGFCSYQLGILTAKSQSISPRRVRPQATGLLPIPTPPSIFKFHHLG